MRSESQRTLFRSLRSQGWSLGRISTHLNIPKSTLYGWDYDDREVTAVLKAVRTEQIQEQYLPTFEEELKHFSDCLARIRKTLQHRSLAWVSTEYLLQLDLQISSRLAKFRAPPPLHCLAEPDPIAVTGCLSRSPSPSCSCSQPSPPPPADPAASPNQSSAATAQDSTRTESYDRVGGTKNDPAVSTTCDDTFRTIVRFSERQPALQSTPTRNRHHDEHPFQSDNGIRHRHDRLQTTKR